MKILFALPGFHKYHRGAEVALLSVADELAKAGEDVTVVGSGKQESGKAYRFQHVPSVSRETFERFPNFPPFRSETAWEDATFAANLVRKVDTRSYDATVTCSFPFTHWALRRGGRKAPAHIFVTQNGEWPAVSNKSEYRFFDCDGLVCINPDYFETNRGQWNCALIPNGADLERFRPCKGDAAEFGLPSDKKIILMVSAFIPTKRVADAVRAVAEIDDAFLVVAGDGPLRDEVQSLAEELLPGRFKRLTLTAPEMPKLYNAADAFLHMSLFESFGNVFVEAMACGLPVVGHDTARLRWIVGEEEYLCDTEDRAQLVGSIRAALSAGQRPLNENLKRFSWTAIADQYRAFIAETLSSR